jgi:hypothetical protein
MSLTLLVVLMTAFAIVYQRTAAELDERLNAETAVTHAFMRSSRPLHSRQFLTTMSSRSWPAMV